MPQELTAARRAAMVPFVFFGASLVAVLWAHWSSLTEVVSCWAHDPQYSHGYLVPLFSLGLLWFRRDLCPQAFQPSWWGVAVLAGGLGLRLFGTYFYFIWFEQISIMPILAGLFLLAGGVQAIRWAWPAIAFLGFMIPLPFWLSGKLTGPLQQLATVVCTFLLQTLGIPAIAEGNVIQLSEVQIGIIEACSGLRMLVIFFALSTAVALVVRRPLWERIVVALSAIPIALVSNVTRITATGVLHELVSSEFANMVFHDLAGWLMMPLALAMLWLELTLISHLLIEPARQAARQGPPARRPAPRTLPPRRTRPGLAA
jgi:exosortase